VDFGYSNPEIFAPAGGSCTYRRLFFSLSFFAACGLTPARNWAGSPALPAQPDARAKAADSALSPAAGEIRVDGLLRAVDAAGSLLTIGVTSVTVHGGSPALLAAPRAKGILLGPRTPVVDRAGARVSLADAHAGSVLHAVGKDAGAGTPLAARFLSIDMPAAAVSPETPGALLAAYRAIRWDSKARGAFILSLCSGPGGQIGVGTEDAGIWRFAPTPDRARWVHFNVRDGSLPDDNGYAMACDRLGRTWAGLRSHGVSVFNGAGWRNYGPLTGGPLGGRVFAIAPCPTDGDVWIASNLGLARYSLKKNAWSYSTRATGLPSDQVNAIAFDAAGNPYLATQCDGIAMAKAADGCAHWSVVSGPAAPPNRPAGDGLPTGLINTLLAAHSGTIFAGTTTGLARSDDDGRSWTYTRGADWRDKANGLYHGLPPAGGNDPAALLAEDDVTAIAEDKERGLLWVGFRQKGVQVLDEATGRTVASLPADMVTSLLVLPGGIAIVGQYGAGLKVCEPPPAPGGAGHGMAFGGQEAGHTPARALPASRSGGQKAGGRLE
jgi:ligand-binding sensor domain-containing protein